MDGWTYGFDIRDRNGSDPTQGISGRPPLLLIFSDDCEHFTLFKGEIFRVLGKE